MASKSSQTPNTRKFARSSKSRQSARTDRDKAKEEMKTDSNNLPTDPKLIAGRTKVLEELLKIISEYEENIMLHKINSVMDGALAKMQIHASLFTGEIEELTKQREELQTEVDSHEPMCEPARKICERLSLETPSKSLKRELQTLRKKQQAQSRR